MSNHPCRHCGAPVGRRYVYHRECLNEVRNSFAYRPFALARDGYVCARCPGWRNRLALDVHRRLNSTRRVDVDHIVPLGLGGPNAPTNLQVLCKHHHRVKTRADMRRMRGRGPNLLRPRYLLPALLLLWLGWSLYDSAATSIATGRTDAYIVGTGAVLWALLLLVVPVVALRRRSLSRLRGTIVQATSDSMTKKGAVKARRWRLVPVPGLRLPRYRPTSILIRYPHTFPDHEPARQAEVEQRVTSKMGGTWYAQWNTEADRVLLRSPDPLVAAAGLPWPNAGADRLSLWDPIPVGVGIDGLPVTMSLVGKNLLIGGEPESGKSVAQSIVTATAALDPDCVLYGIDGKRMVELAPWSGSMERLVCERTDAIDLLDGLRAHMDLRYEMLLDRGARKVERGDGLDLHLLVIDELALFTAAGTKQEQDRFTSALRDVISRGRAAGIIVVAATQRPSSTVVSTDVRDLIGYRWALRSSTPQASDMILGQGQASAGFSSARVAAEHRGIGYLLAEGALPVRLRSYRIDDPTLATLAERAARSRRGRVSPNRREPTGPEPSPST